MELKCAGLVQVSMQRKRDERIVCETFDVKDHAVVELKCAGLVQVAATFGN